MSLTEAVFHQPMSVLTPTFIITLLVRTPKSRTKKVVLNAPIMQGTIPTFGGWNTVQFKLMDQSSYTVEYTTANAMELRLKKMFIPAGDVVTFTWSLGLSGHINDVS